MDMFVILQISTAEKLAEELKRKWKRLIYFQPI